MARQDAPLTEAVAPHDALDEERSSPSLGIRSLLAVGSRRMALWVETFSPPLLALSCYLSFPSSLSPSHSAAAPRRHGIVWQPYWNNSQPRRDWSVFFHGRAHASARYSRADPWLGNASVRDSLSVDSMLCLHRNPHIRTATIRRYDFQQQIRDSMLREGKRFVINRVPCKSSYHRSFYYEISLRFVHVSRGRRKKERIFSI